MKINWTLAEQRAFRNLNRIWNLATPEDKVQGGSWYPTANRQIFDLSVKHNIPLDAALGAVAALSPGLRWDLNLSRAEFLFKAFDTEYPETETYGLSPYGKRNVQKAWRILRGEEPLAVLSGPKVRAFYSCLRDPFAPDVVVDGHMKFACLGTRRGIGAAAVSVSEYPHWVAVIRKLARRLALRASQLQAILWLAWRKISIGKKI